MDDATRTDAGNVDETQSTESKALKTLNVTQIPLSSSLTNLSSSSATLPSSKEFHFFYNFDQFKFSVQDIAVKSQTLLDRIGETSHIWAGKPLPYPADDDTAYDWLVDLNDEIYERFDESFGEFERGLKEEEDSGGPVCEEARKKLADKDKKKGKIPFHVAKIRKPQEEYNILVDNSNQPFDHAWLQRSDDGKRFIHPLEKLSVLDFVDKEVGGLVPVTPPSTETTLVKLVEEVRDLEEMANKLHTVNEFAVDLEHNQYRSFQGLTCLMQISTRTDDFVVDTLKLWTHVGPYLREVFRDPTKKKVMHGADRDIIWLQRDFGIYVCNMFDTGQASRILKLERNSLAYLLHHFCGVTANKEYQNADWRLRPLPDEMLRYARDDTHYLLYIYDLTRIQLFSMPKESENSDTPLIEVYKRSYDVCMQLYEKEILAESSYLHIHGLQGAGFNAQQLAIFAGLYEWRNEIAREEDESTGYILPNKALLELAKQMPVTTSKLRWLVKLKHPCVERNLTSVVRIIRHSMQNADAFEGIAEHLKKGGLELAGNGLERELEGLQANMVGKGQSKGSLPENHTTMDNKKNRKENIYGPNKINVSMSPNLLCPDLKRRPLGLGAALDANMQGRYSRCTVENGGIRTGLSMSKSKIPSQSSSVPGSSKSRIDDKATMQLAKNSGVAFQVLKGPNPAFGEHLGSSSSTKKPGSSKKLLKKPGCSSGGQAGSSSSNTMLPESSKKRGTGRIDAALDAMQPFGFANELVHQTVAELLSVYGEEAGWPFLEEASYTLLIETLLEKQNGVPE